MRLKAVAQMKHLLFALLGGCFTYAFIPSIYGLEVALIAVHLLGPSGSFRALKRLLVEKPINQSLQIRLSSR